VIEPHRRGATRGHRASDG